MYKYLVSSVIVFSALFMFVGVQAETAGGGGQGNTGGGIPGGTEPGAAVDCFSLNSSAAIPSGYGAAYDLTSSAKPLLLKARCTDTGQVFEVGDGASNMYVYKQGHRWNGSEWVAFTLSGSNAIDANWFSGKASTQLSIAAPDLENNNYVVAYTCRYVNNTWKCGCTNAACTTPKWQLQIIKRMPSVPGGLPGITLTNNKTSVAAKGSFTLTLKNASNNPVQYKAGKLCFATFEKLGSNNTWTEVSLLGTAPAGTGGAMAPNCPGTALNAGKTYAQGYEFASNTPEGQYLAPGTYRAYVAIGNAKAYSGNFTVTGGTGSTGSVTLTANASSVKQGGTIGFTYKNGTSAVAYHHPNGARCNVILKQKVAGQGATADQMWQMRWPTTDVTCTAVVAELAPGGQVVWSVILPDDIPVGTYAAFVGNLKSQEFTITGTAKPTIALSSNKTEVAPLESLTLTLRNNGTANFSYNPNIACNIRFENRVLQNGVAAWVEVSFGGAAACPAVAGTLAAGTAATYTMNVPNASVAQGGIYRARYEFGTTKVYTGEIEFTGNAVGTN